MRRKHTKKKNKEREKREEGEEEGGGVLSSVPFIFEFRCILDLILVHSGLNLF